jgi:type IV secretion system protein VirD4
MARARPHPSVLLILVPVVVSAFAFYVANWRWPELATGMTGKAQYWFLRLSPLPVLLFGPLAGLLTVWALPLHRRRPIAMASFLCFLLMAGFYGLREIARLSPFVERGTLTWDQALSFLDMIAVASAALGFMAAAV